MEGLWHVPLVFWAGDPMYGMSIPLLMIWQMIATFHRTWILNNIGGSIFSAIAFHAVDNTASYVVQFNLPYVEWLPKTKFISPFLLTLNIVVIFGLILIFGAETMSRRNKPNHLRIVIFEYI